jgi:HK97 family phage prohead protease
MADDLEYRYSKVEADGATRLRGTAIVFNALSRDLGGFREIIAPEAVNRTLSQADEVFAFWNHDAGVVLGSTRSGTLTLRKDNYGLHVEIDPPKSAAAIVESVQRGDVRGMSFAFRVMPGGLEWDDRQHPPVRVVRDMQFSEVSIVAKAAYTQTDVSVALRSLQEYKAQQRNTSVAWLQRVHKTRLAR